LVLALVFSLVNLPCIAIWASFGSGLRKVLQSPQKLRIFNGVMAAGLVASLYPMLRN
jgi:threonine/homoserine/homoserine lactone efflux protein